MNASRRALASAVAAGAWLALADGAQAQSLDAVVVRARGPQRSTLTAPGVERAKAEAAEVPGGASVVDMAPRQDEKVSNLADALAETPGVFAQTRFGQDELRLSIRGSGLQRSFHLRGVELLQDGVPLNQADGGGDFQAADPLAARYIEVRRGANALRYGSTTLGGAVNLVSPTGYDVHGAAWRAEAGSFGFRRLHAIVGAGDGRFDYAVSVSGYREDGFRKQSRTDNARLFANLGWKLAGNVETRWYLAYVDSGSELPGNLTRAQLRDDPRAANPVNLALNQQRDFRLVRIAQRTVIRLDGMRLELGAFAAHKALFHPIFQVLDVDSDDLGLVARLSSIREAWGRPLRWIVGMEPHTTRQTDLRHENLGGTRGALLASSLQTAANLDVYGEVELDLTDATTLVAGAQATRATRRYDDRLRAGGVDRGFDLEYTNIAPKLGFVHRLGDSASVFGNASGAFEPPSFGELAGGPGVTPLRAQRAASFELGTRGAIGAGPRNAPRGSSIEWDVTVYQAALRGELLGMNDVNGQPLGTVNAGRSVHRGLEAAATAALGARVHAGLAWLVQDFRLDGDPVYGNNLLPGLPRQFLRGHLLLDVPGGVRVGPTLEWSPRRYPVDLANTLFVDRYAIWGVRASGSLGRRLAWWIDARNLSNRRYAASSGVIADARGLDSAQFLPGNGRSIYAGLRLALEE